MRYRPSADLRVHRRIGDAVRRHRVAVGLLGPAVAVILSLLWGSALWGAWISLHEWPLAGSPAWVGLENYLSVLASERFHHSLAVTAIYLLSVVGQVAIGVAAALAVANVRRFRNLLSGVYVIGFAMPPVIVALLWRFLLSPTFSPVFRSLRPVLPAELVFWQVNGPTAMGVIVFVMSWAYWPFVFLIVLAARESVPDREYEVAKVYGANHYQLFRHVTLVHLKKAIVVAFCLRFVWTLSNVAIPLTLTNGGPGYETSVVGVLFYRVTLLGQLGEAYTIGILLFAISAVGIVPYVLTMGDRA